MNRPYAGKKLKAPLPEPMPEAHSLMAEAPKLVQIGLKKGWIKPPSQRALTDTEIANYHKNFTKK